MTDLTATQPPFLCIETKAHNAAMRDAAIAPDGQWLLTVSDDKTARMWSLPELRPLGVLRPAIGPLQEGRLYGVAVSPDGQTAAIGGFTGRDGSSDFSVYVFDLTSQAIIRRLSGLPNVVYTLAFARDGRLAAGLGGDNGIRVWQNGALQFEDLAYGDSVHGIAFAPNGWLAAGSYDGQLRLYDESGVLLQKLNTEVGEKPFRMAFSSDGSLLAVGFEGIAAVEVRDGTTLALRTRPDCSGLAGSNLARVAWSADGRTLLAGGNVSGGTEAFPAWPAAGSGPRRMTRVDFSDPIFAVAPFPPDGVAVASSAGDIVVIGKDGTVRHHHRPTTSDLATSPGHASPSRRLRLSADATLVEWVTWPAQGRLLRFDVANLDLANGKDEAPGLAAWSADAGNLHATDWSNRTDPKLNGRALKLHLHERARSVSAAHNRLLLGTDWRLRLFDAKAAELWSTSVPGTAWRVNQSPDGRLAVAGLGDGTIRWYRADNGEQLLALMVTEDAQRWVTFTPSGYYAAGPGAEDLIGWHVNRGPDQAADFFPASRFRDRFNRPDVVRRILATLDEAEAVRQADTTRGADASRAPPSPAALAAELLQERPPVVIILAPRTGASLRDEAELLVEARSPTGRPITLVEVRLNGRPVPDATVEPPESAAAPGGELAERRWIRLILPPDEDCTIQVIAHCEDRVSDAATLFRPRHAAPVLRKPRLSAVLVGISDYQNETLRLKFAAKDASDLAVALRRQAGEGGLYREVNVDVMPEAHATRRSILQRLVELQRSTAQGDLAILFLAGHGLAEDIEYYFLTVDADPDMPSVDGLSGSDLRRHLRLIPGRTLVFLDTCYAGAIVEGRTTRDLPLDIGKFLNELASPETGVVVYSATTGRQRAEELAMLKNGVFTAALLETLDGRAGQPAHEPIRLNILGTLLAERVRTLSNGKQTPVYNPLDPLPDLPLFLVR
jgi:WD40 repeat protein